MHIEALRDSANRPLPPSGLEGSSLHTSERRMNFVACITVTRQSSDDAGVREIYVSVDGEEIAVLKNGQAVTHELPAGPHRLRAHNTLFWKTHDVVLQPGEHARFKAANLAGWAVFGFLIALGAAPLKLLFEREVN
ncbi:MAG: hypothetical protein ABW292_00965 [Vicinamibacterales bacterium]